MSGQKKQSELLEVLTKNNKLADEIRKVTLAQSRKIKYDINNPEEDSVINGLVFRIFSITLDISCHPMLMNSFYFALAFRPALESYLYLMYLANKNNSEEYKSFIDYGIGQENLYKLNLQELMEKGEIEETEELKDYIQATSSIDNRDEFIKIHLKSWKDIYRLFNEMDMKEKHSLYYHPLSLEVHGVWPSLTRHSLTLCKEPLHAFHYKPDYPDRYMDSKNMVSAIELFNQTYDFWIRHYNLKDELSVVFKKHLGHLAKKRKTR